MPQIYAWRANATHKALARHHADALEAGDSALVISPSNAEKDLVTQAIRGEPKSRGMLGPHERSLTIYKRYQ